MGHARLDSSLSGEAGRIVVGFSAGSATDLIGRVLAGKLGDGLGQSVVSVRELIAFTRATPVWASSWRHRLRNDLPRISGAKRRSMPS